MRHFPTFPSPKLFVLVILILGNGYLLNRAFLQTPANTRYIHQGGGCSATPCHTSLAEAFAMSKDGDTLLIESDLIGSVEATPTAQRITLRATQPDLKLKGALRLRAVTDWVIQGFTVTDQLLIGDVSGSLKVTALQVAAIYIQPTRYLNAQITITGNRLPGIFDFPKVTSEISVLGANGQRLAGDYVIADNRGVGALNIFTYVEESGFAGLDANIQVKNNELVNSANLGITYRGNQGGRGAITGNITFTKNTVLTRTKGLNVTVDGPATLGDIQGTIIFRENRSDKLAAITIDSFGGAFSGDFIAEYNIGERIEFGVKGNCTARSIQIVHNQLTYQGSPENTVITVRADQFSAETLIRVSENTGKFGIAVETYTGNNNAFTQIIDNSTFFITYRTGAATTASFVIARNRITPDDPLGTRFNGLLSVWIGAGDVRTGTLAENSGGGVDIVVSTRLIGTITLQKNEFTAPAGVRVNNPSGDGLIELIGNHFPLSVTLDGVTSVARFNRFLGAVSLYRTTLDARDNWWGCSQPRAASCRYPIFVNESTLIDTPYLTFQAQAVCLPSGEASVAADVLRNSVGEFPTGNQLSVQLTSALRVQEGWGAIRSTLPMTLQLDRDPAQTLNWPCRAYQETPALYRSTEGAFYLSHTQRQIDDNRPADQVIVFGESGLVPLTGDWDGDGFTALGVFDPKTAFFSLKNKAQPGDPDHIFIFGKPGDLPIAGRWDSGMRGDGVGVFNPIAGVVSLRRELAKGSPDYSIVFGAPGMIPVAGDWNGDGFDGIGMYDPVEGRFRLVNRLTGSGIGEPELDFLFGGEPGDLPVTGHWSGGGVSGVGVRRGSAFLLNSTLGASTLDQTFGFGSPGDYPLMGRWR
jgi:hypothetical protein